METIIQQIVAELARKIVTRAYSGGISDVDALASDVLGDCKAASVSIIETICSELNLEIRQDKERGKASKIVPLVTVTEGTETECERRHRTIAPMHFVDEKFSTKELWKSAEGYIGKAYNLEKLETI